MKPFDWGYFLKDSRGALYNLRRADHQLSVTAVPLPAQLGEIAHIQVAENRQQNFYGYAITAASEVYLLSYPDYRLIPLALDYFDHTRMRMQLLSDPLSYLVRYDDRRDDYRAVLFDRDFQRRAAIAFP